eukprot:TRINITY_DN1132_c0_g1_i2.p1 TRINITY_DN1132_c0_g1~~TRINITY_DN1132_c0_g1_i2.p1  ORF type:complete len:886 (+),score=139.99 TRINITY_DN1132_c0_g1_i2:6390-9047(+)
MSSHSDMESVSISDVEMEVGEEATPNAVSQPPPQAPVPTPGISLPQSTSQPTPKRITMRERALAMREARLKKNQAKSAKQSGEVAGKNPAQHVIDDGMQEDDSANGATASTARQEPTPRTSQRAKSSTAPESSTEPSRHESQSSGSKHSGPDGKKSEAQATGKGKRTQSRRETSTRKGSRTNTTVVKPTESLKDAGDPNLVGPNETTPNGPTVGIKEGSKMSKTGSGPRKDQRKRKLVSDAVEGKEDKDDSGNESDVVLLQTKAGTATPSRAKKKARVESAKSVASPKATSRSLKKKKGAVVPQSPPDAAATAQNVEIAANPEHDKAETPSKKKRTLKKNTRTDVRVLQDDEPLLVRDTRANKPGSLLPSKDPQSSEVGEENPKPLPPKRRPGRPRKYPRVDTPDPKPTTKTSGGEENVPKSMDTQEEPVSGKKNQRQTKSRGKKVKQAAPEETENAKKSNHEDDEGKIVQVSKEKATPRLASRSALKRKSPMQSAPDKGQQPQADHVATDKVSGEREGSKQIDAAKAQAQVNEESVNTVTQSPTRAKETSLNDAALRSATKSKRTILAPSPRASSIVRPRELNMNASRRQSLSHQEGLSRLTSVVDQLQREGEAFLQTEHQICDQLVPFPPGWASHRASNLPYGNVSAPVSEDDRRAIADNVLRDAVTHAKLEYQAKQRAAISELAENLVKAMKNWKDAKNAVLRDIIPEELRPEARAPLETLVRDGHYADVHGNAPISKDTTGVPDEDTPNENEEPNVGLGMNEERVTTPNGNGNAQRTSRQETVAKIRVLENAEALKRFAGYSYSDLNLNCYRSCAILKLCEFDGGLSYEELYHLTPIGRVLLRRKLSSLVQSSYLLEKIVEVSPGEHATVYRTAPHVSVMN